MIKEPEIKALIILLDDEDREIASHIETKIMSLGARVIPMLEQEWGRTSNPIIQDKIECLVHELQFELLKERFVEWKENESDDLLKGLWIIATYTYPNLNIDELSQEIEQLYHEVWRHMEDEMDPYDRIKTFNKIFFNTLKFKANTNNAFSPANSMINAVLESRKGNPMLLCSIYLLLAKKMDLPVYGINLPKLFMLIYQVGEDPFYISVYNHGLVFTKDDIDNYLESLELEKNSGFYTPCSNLDIIIRTLQNLLISFEKYDEYDKADEVKVILQKINDQYFSF